jgi:hypothetical protein
MMNHHPKALRRYSVASLVTDQVGRFWKADPGHSPKAPKLLRLVVGEMDDIVAGVFDQILEANHASVDTQFVQ